MYLNTVPFGSQSYGIKSAAKTFFNTSPDSLKLEEIGSIVSRYFTPTTVIHNSHPSPPVRIYAGKKTCGPEYSCKQIVVIISEFMPPLEIRPF